LQPRATSNKDIMEHTPISPEEAADRLVIRELVDAHAHCADRRDELSTRSETFRTRWATHNVRFHDHGTKDVHHPVVGELSLNFERMERSPDTGLTTFASTADPGSKSQESLNLLASWAATLDAEAQAGATEGHQSGTS
jgi:MmyB-like transcription regulator ligand binding domain